MDSSDIVGSVCWACLAIMHLIRTAESESRCYCNDPSCVTTSYMCKSSTGICFSQISQDGPNSLRFYHACSEMLPEKDLSASCIFGEDVRSKVVRSSHKWSEIICCTTDMCNYKDRLSSHLSSLTNIDDKRLKNGDSDQQTFSGGHVWFQAVVIAVSLIGTTVLLFLLLVTVKIVVFDQRRRQKSLFSKTRKPCHVIELSCYSRDDEAVEVGQCHLTDCGCRTSVGDELGAQIEHSFDRCSCCDREVGGRTGGGGGAKVHPITYHCLAVTSGRNAFDTELVPRHHSYCHLHQHHRHLPIVQSHSQRPLFHHDKYDNEKDGGKG